MSNPPRNGEGDRPQGGGGGPAILRQPIKQIKRAHRLRREMSLPAVLLWKELKERPSGFKFRREFPQSPLTLDFVCLSARLIIEVDGAGHDMGNQPTVDESRDRLMAERGFRTLRLPARDVLKDMESCVIAIVAACREAGPPPPPLRGGPPPRSGEDLE